jgi:hypothetical protein
MRWHPLGGDTTLKHMQAFWDRTSVIEKWIHGFLAAWVCSNLAFNYMMAILTPPGSTRTIAQEVCRAPFHMPMPTVACVGII